MVRKSTYDAVQNGYWHARQPEFFASRGPASSSGCGCPADLIFLFVGILPVVDLPFHMFAVRRRDGKTPAGSPPANKLTQWYEEA